MFMQRLGVKYLPEHQIYSIDVVSGNIDTLIVDTILQVGYTCRGRNFDLKRFRITFYKTPERKRARICRHRTSMIEARNDDGFKLHVNL